MRRSEYERDMSKILARAEEIRAGAMLKFGRRELEVARCISRNVVAAMEMPRRAIQLFATARGDDGLRAPGMLPLPPNLCEQWIRVCSHQNANACKPNFF